MILHSSNSKYPKLCGPYQIDTAVVGDGKLDMHILA
jgi:hypothetical protein